MFHRVSAPPPAHLLQDLRVLQEHREEQRALQQQQRNSAFTSVQQDREAQLRLDGLSSNALVNVTPLVRTPEQTVLSIRSELATLEPQIRVHAPNSTARLTSLFSQLKALLDDRHVELDPELEVEAQDMLQRMHWLIEAARAKVFKNIVVKGPAEYAADARAAAKQAKVAALKDELAWKWSLEDYKQAKLGGSQKKQRAANKRQRSTSSSHAKETIDPANIKGFGSKGYSKQKAEQAARLAAADARVAKRRRSGLGNLQRRAVSSDEEEEEEEQDQSEESSSVDGERGEESALDPANFRTPKRARDSTGQVSAHQLLWPSNSAITPSTANGSLPASQRRSTAASALAQQQLRVQRAARPQAPAAHRHHARPSQTSDDEQAEVRPVQQHRSIRRRPLVLPSKDDSSGESQEATQPLLDDSTPAIFLSIIAERRAATAAAPAAAAPAALEAESPVIRKRVAASGSGSGRSSSGGASPEVPLPNQELLQANWRAGRFSLADEAFDDTEGQRRSVGNNAFRTPSPNENRPPVAAASSVARKHTLLQQHKSPSAPLLASTAAKAKLSHSQRIIEDQDPFAFDL